MKITIETEVNAEPATVWDSWTTPEDITQWYFATDEWCCPRAEIDLQTGGRFCYRMEAKDGSMGFDFAGRFTRIETHRWLEFELDDDRTVAVEFTPTTSGVKVMEIFEAEDENSARQQKQGWQSILDNFKRHVESQRDTRRLIAKRESLP